MPALLPARGSRGRHGAIPRFPEPRIVGPDPAQFGDRPVTPVQIRRIHDQLTPAPVVAGPSVQAESKHGRAAAHDAVVACVVPYGGGVTTAADFDAGRILGRKAVRRDPWAARHVHDNPCPVDFPHDRARRRLQVLEQHAAAPEVVERHGPGDAFRAATIQGGKLRCVPPVRGLPPAVGGVERVAPGAPPNTVDGYVLVDHGRDAHAGWYDRSAS